MRQRSLVIASFVGLGLGLSVTACGDDGSSRADVLAAYATDVALPRYELFASVADEMVIAVEEACSAPSEELVAGARVAVDETRGGWLATLAMSTGPAMERRSVAAIDWPVRVDDVERFVTDSEPGAITAVVIANNVGADTRGLSALRWVLSTDDVIERLGDERWCDYVSATATVVADESHLLLDDWTVSFAGGDPFADVLADDADETWLDMIVNDNINLVHKLTEAPDDEDAAVTGVAADRSAQLDGVLSVMAAIGPLLGDDLAERLEGEVDAARAAYAAGDVDAGREAAAAVEATLATEVASRLGVTIGFSDADGDSAG